MALSRSGSCLYELWCHFLIPRKIIFRFYVCIFEGILYVCFKIVSCVGLNLGAGVVLSWLIFMYVLVANQFYLSRAETNKLRFFIFLSNG